MTNNLLLLSPIRFVAQLVEQLTLNQRAQGSNPCRPTENEAITSGVIVSFYFYTYQIHTNRVKKALPKDSKNKNRPQNESGFKVIWRLMNYITITGPT